VCNFKSGRAKSSIKSSWAQGWGRGALKESPCLQFWVSQLEEARSNPCQCEPSPGLPLQRAWRGHPVPPFYAWRAAARGWDNLGRFGEVGTGCTRCNSCDVICCCTSLEHRFIPPWPILKFPMKI